MQAAVVRSFGRAPAFETFAEPEPAAGEIVLDVVASGLHPLVRSRAAGSHYSSTGELPLIPGIDGVGRDVSGRLRYFALDGANRGAMAERVAVDPRRTITLADDADPVAVAAAMNPAMSSWIALRQRIAFEPGQSVLVLGATGNAGRMAVQAAIRLGASRVVAAGRDAERLAGLEALGAGDLVSLAGDPAEVARRLAASAADVDVVLDYVWGEPTAAAMVAIVTARADRGHPLAWVEIGSVAGQEAGIPSAALRAARLTIVGSGQGSVPTRDIVRLLPSLADEIAGGTFAVDADAVPLADVAEAWADDGRSGRRIVFTP